MLQVDPGFKAENLLTMQVSVNSPDGHKVASFFQQLQENVRRLPGVKSVAVSNGLPLRREPSDLHRPRSSASRKRQRITCDSLHGECRLLRDYGYRVD